MLLTNVGARVIIVQIDVRNCEIVPDFFTLNNEFKENRTAQNQLIHFSSLITIYFRNFSV